MCEAQFKKEKEIPVKREKTVEIKKVKVIPKPGVKLGLSDYFNIAGKLFNRLLMNFMGLENDFGIIKAVQYTVTGLVILVFMGLIYKIIF